MSAAGGLKKANTEWSFSCLFTVNAVSGHRVETGLQAFLPLKMPHSGQGVEQGFMPFTFENAALSHGVERGLQAFYL